VHPPDATAQGLIACLDRRWDFPSISSSRLVAHEPNAFHYDLPRPKGGIATALTIGIFRARL
jgi:hypothetical protein